VPGAARIAPTGTTIAGVRAALRMLRYSLSRMTGT